eukprot:5432302-Pyramimonas_sp.AAC.1
MAAAVAVTSRGAGVCDGRAMGELNSQVIILLPYTGPPVPITARMQSTPQNSRVIRWLTKAVLTMIDSTDRSVAGARPHRPYGTRVRSRPHRLAHLGEKGGGDAHPGRPAG